MDPTGPKNRSPGPVSIAPRTATIDDDWSDDIFAGTFELPDADGSEHDRITAVPSLPTDEYVARAMADARNTVPAKPDPKAPPAPVEVSPARRGPVRYSDSLDPPLPETLPPEEFEPDSDRITVEAPLPELDDIDLGLDDDLDASTLGTPSPLLESRGGADPAGIELEQSEPPAGRSDDPLTVRLKDRYALGDFSGALAIAEELLATDPNDFDAARYAQSCRSVLTDMYAARVGRMDQVVHVAVAPEQVRWLALDHRAGFLLSLVDGASSVEELLDICGMPALDALRILAELLEQSVIRTERRR